MDPAKLITPAIVTSSLAPVPVKKQGTLGALNSRIYQVFRDIFKAIYHSLQVVCEKLTGLLKRKKVQPLTTVISEHSPTSVIVAPAPAPDAKADLGRDLLKTAYVLAPPVQSSYMDQSATHVNSHKSSAVVPPPEPIDTLHTGSTTLESEIPTNAHVKSSIDPVTVAEEVHVDDEKSRLRLPVDSSTKDKKTKPISATTGSATSTTTSGTTSVVKAVVSTEHSLKGSADTDENDLGFVVPMPPAVWGLVKQASNLVAGALHQLTSDSTLEAPDASSAPKPEGATSSHVDEAAESNALLVDVDATKGAKATMATSNDELPASSNIALPHDGVDGAEEEDSDTEDDYTIEGKWWDFDKWQNPLKSIFPWFTQSSYTLDDGNLDDDSVVKSSPQQDETITQMGVAVVAPTVEDGDGSPKASDTASTDSLQTPTTHADLVTDSQQGSSTGSHDGDDAVAINGDDASHTELDEQSLFGFGSSMEISPAPAPKSSVAGLSSDGLSIEGGVTTSDPAASSGFTRWCGRIIFGIINPHVRAIVNTVNAVKSVLPGHAATPMLPNAAKAVDLAQDILLPEASSEAKPLLPSTEYEKATLIPCLIQGVVSQVNTATDQVMQASHKALHTKSILQSVDCASLHPAFIIPGLQSVFHQPMGAVYDSCLDGVVQQTLSGMGVSTAVSLMWLPFSKGVSSSLLEIEERAQSSKYALAGQIRRNPKLSLAIGLIRPKKISEEDNWVTAVASSAYSCVRAKKPTDISSQTQAMELIDDQVKTKQDCHELAMDLTALELQSSLTHTLSQYVIRPIALSAAVPYLGSAIFYLLQSTSYFSSLDQNNTDSMDWLENQTGISTLAYKTTIAACQMGLYATLAIQALRGMRKHHEVYSSIKDESTH